MTIRRLLTVILAAAPLAAGLAIAQAQEGGAGAGNATTAANPFLRRDLRERHFFNANRRIIPRRTTSECSAREFSGWGC